MISFVRGIGRPRELAVIRPQMRQFIADLKSGDHVQVSYDSGLAIELEPAAQ